MALLALILLALGTGAPGATAASPAPTAATDTVFALQPGERLSLGPLDGRVEVRGWERDEVRIVDDARRPSTLRIDRRDGAVRVVGAGEPVELTVEVPRGVALRIEGRSLDVEVEGTRGALSVRTVEGRIELVDVSGDVRASSLDGAVEARDVSGRVSVGTADDDVTVRGARGRLTVSTTDGDVTLTDVSVDTLEAVSTDGDIDFEGRPPAGGRYRLSTHDGDIEAVLPDDADVRVEVSTFAGSFEATFPVVLDGVRTGRSTSFTLGEGRASLALEAFAGEIVVRRPGTSP